MSQDIHLDGHHRATVQEIFAHPVSHNIAWHDVESLLREVGTEIEEHNGRITLTIGDETESLGRRPGKQIGVQEVVDLRRMLEHAGITPEAIAAHHATHHATREGGAT